MLHIWIYDKIQSPLMWRKRPTIEYIKEGKNKRRNRKWLLSIIYSYKEIPIIIEGLAIVLTLMLNTSSNNFDFHGFILKKNCSCVLSTLWPFYLFFLNIPSWLLQCLRSSSTCVFVSSPCSALALMVLWLCMFSPLSYPPPTLPSTSPFPPSVYHVFPCFFGGGGHAALCFSRLLRSCHLRPPWYFCFTFLLFSDVVKWGYNFHVLCVRVCCTMWNIGKKVCQSFSLSHNNPSPPLPHTMWLRVCTGRFTLSYINSRTLFSFIIVLQMHGFKYTTRFITWKACQKEEEVEEDEEQNEHLIRCARRVALGPDESLDQGVWQRDKKKNFTIVAKMQQA